MALSLVGKLEIGEVTQLKFNESPDVSVGYRTSPTTLTLTFVYEL